MEPDVIVIIHHEAEVNARLIHTARRKLFYTICHICITNIHYHGRKVWTHLRIVVFFFFTYKHASPINNMNFVSMLHLQFNTSMIHPSIINHKHIDFVSFCITKPIKYTTSDIIQ